MKHFALCPIVGGADLNAAIQVQILESKLQNDLNEQYDKKLLKLQKSIMEYLYKYWIYMIILIIWQKIPFIWLYT